jgi:hypothetical protein
VWTVGTLRSRITAFIPMVVLAAMALVETAGRRWC